MNDQIDYSHQINYFKELTSTQDDDTALKYLMKNEWDIEVIIKILNNLLITKRAIRNYFDDITLEHERNRGRDEMVNSSSHRTSSPIHNTGLVGSFFDKINNICMNI